MADWKTRILEGNINAGLYGTDSSKKHSRRNQNQEILPWQTETKPSTPKTRDNLRSLREETRSRREQVEPRRDLYNLRQRVERRDIDERALERFKKEVAEYSSLDNSRFGNIDKYIDLVIPMIEQGLDTNDNLIKLRYLIYKEMAHVYDL